MSGEICRFSRVVIFVMAGLALAAECAPVQIKNGSGELIVDEKGLTLNPVIASCPVITATEKPFWAVLIQPAVNSVPLSAPIVLNNLTQTPRYEKTYNGVRIVYDRLTDGKRQWKLSLIIDVHSQGDAFEITGDVKNSDPEWLVCGFTGPVLSGVQVDLASHPALLADGFGRRVNRPPESPDKTSPWRVWGTGYEIEAPYPSRKGCMQWSSFAGEQGGLYLGCHDADHGAKTFCLRYDPADKQYALAIKHQMFCAAGQSWKIPPTVIMPYQGSWHVAADFYRNWYDSVTDQCDAPAWARNSSGWLLAILKQQNGEIMWDYPSLPTLCDVADQRGLDILGLFGWAHGGHDHLYPDYFPDPEMGGEKALRTALKEIRSRGKRSIIYANGQLQEIDAPFWKTQGKDLTVIKRDGTPVQQTYHKYHNAPPRHFGLGCLASQGWFERMLSLAVQSNDLGADGILYDQLGISVPMACYAPNHGHPVPTMVYAGERPAFIRRIAAHMKKINPEFIVMTEGLHDSVLDSISMFHGCMLGMFEVTSGEMASRIERSLLSDAFPEMFRYTFPEVMSTVRLPTPMMNRVMANYTCTYGLRYEIESRYGPDVPFLLENKIPKKEEYTDVRNKPNLEMMQQNQPEVANRYLKSIIEFQRANAGLLWCGNYTDTRGFDFNGKNLIAKGFTSGDRMGIIIWNPGEAAAPFTLKVPEAERVSASEPEKSSVDAFSPLAPHTVRLLVWKKNHDSLGKINMKLNLINAFGYTGCIEMVNDAGTRVVLCPQGGGRVLEYSLNGKNALYVNEAQNGWRYQPGVETVDPCGGRFDIGPERVIAPHDDLWLGDWTGEILDDGRARLISKCDSVTGIRLVRTFTLAADSSRLFCRQTMINESDKPFSCCHWSRTLAAGGGICLIPLTPESRFPKSYIMYGPDSVMYYQPEDPNIRIRDGFLEVIRTPSNPKLGLDSTAGWFCYLMRNDLMFIKRFPVYPDRVYNEMAGLTISVWYFRNEMCELEPIGPREILAPGASASYTEEWELLPYDFPKQGEDLDLRQVRAAVDG